MIPLLIGIFLIILFIVFLVLSASTWRGWHITVACLTFLSVLGFVVVASLSVKTHNYWKSEHAKTSAALEKEIRDGIHLEMGDPAVVESTEPYLNKVQQRLNRLLLDRGRVWRRCYAPNPPAQNQITLSTVPLNPDGSPGDPTTAKENGINDRMVLYGFREAEVMLAEDRRLFVPVAFLGEFRVTNAQPDSVTLTPTMPLDGQQAALVNDTSATWVLYEMMPLDAHNVFSDQETIGRPLDNTTDQPIFGEMDEQQLRTTFARVTGLATDDPLITQLVTNYIKDGYAASDQEVNMSPENIWQKLEFEKAHTERVDSNNLDPGISGNYFDPDGFAEATRLRNGKDAEFRVNDIGVFPYSHDQDKQVVDQLTASGICQKIGPMFVRSLNDYEEAFHDIQTRFVKRTEDIRRAKRDIDNLNSTISDTQQQIAYRQAEREKLKEDQTGFARDNQKMDQLVAQLEAQKSSLTDELSEIYRTNLALSQQLAIYNAKLTEEINRRAASVAVQQP
jgi:hypothetical protein